MGTGISWTDETWNPTIGCDRVSAGCDHCYAIRDSARQVGAKHPAYEGVLTIGNRDWSGRVNLVPDRLTQPLRWKRPRRIFVNSMSDLFHPEIPADYIARVFASMAFASWHQFQVLTKRPQRMAEIVGAETFRMEVEARLTDLAAAHRTERSDVGNRARQLEHLLATPAGLEGTGYTEPDLAALLASLSPPPRLVNQTRTTRRCRLPRLSPNAGTCGSWATTG